MEIDNNNDLIELICKNQNNCQCEKSLKILSTVNSNYADYEMSLRYIQDSIGLSATQIYEYCKSRFQTTPGKLISFIRLYNCLNKFRFSEESVSYIGIKCGFKNMKTFRNQIHNTFNQSPSELLNEIRSSPLPDKKYQFYLELLIKQIFIH